MAHEVELLILEVATPVGLALRTEAENVAAPSVEGEFGVFPGHLPLLAAIKPGVLKYRVGGKELAAAVGAGFVEAEPNKVLLLCDVFAAAADIDVAKVRIELSKAESDLEKFEGDYNGAQYEELQRRIAWCNARIQAKEENKAH